MKELEFTMKPKLFSFAIALGFCAVLTLSGCAHQQSAVQNNSRDSNENYLTGSYLPQDVSRNGPVTNGKSDVRVIDRSDIDRSGGADPRQTLRQLGVSP